LRSALRAGLLKELFFTLDFLDLEPREDSLLEISCMYDLWSFSALFFDLLFDYSEVNLELQAISAAP
jgi:hypothetical protein